MIQEAPRAQMRDMRGTSGGAGVVVEYIIERPRGREVACKRAEECGQGEEARMERLLRVGGVGDGVTRDTAKATDDPVRMVALKQGGDGVGHEGGNQF